MPDFVETICKLTFELPEYVGFAFNIILTSISLRRKSSHFGTDHVDNIIILSGKFFL